MADENTAPPPNDITAEALKAFGDKVARITGLSHDLNKIGEIQLALRKRADPRDA